MEVLISHGDDGGAKGLHGGEDEDPTATRRDDSPIGWTGGRRAQKKGMQGVALVKTGRISGLTGSVYNNTRPKLKQDEDSQTEAYSGVLSMVPPHGPSSILSFCA